MVLKVGYTTYVIVSTHSPFKMVGDRDNITDDEDFLELVNIVQQKGTASTLSRSHHFVKWSHKEFLAKFCLSKNGVRFCIQYTI